MLMYKVFYQPEAAEQLGELRAFDRVRLLDAIDLNLREQPATEGVKKTRLELGGTFIWELRVGDYRVFYDVVDEHRLVIVRQVEGTSGTRARA